MVVLGLLWSIALVAHALIGYSRFSGGWNRDLPFVIVGALIAAAI